MGRTSGEGLENRLRELRTHHKMTQAELAKQIGVSRQTIVAVEKGEYNPSVVMALRIAAVFNEPVESIFWLNQQE